MYVVFGGKLDCGRIEGSMEIMVPVCGEIVIVAGETTSLFSLSNITARLETRTVNGILESFGGVGRKG